MSEGPYTRVTWRGHTVNARTRDCLKYAEGLWQKRGGHKKTIQLAQGSYRKATSYSGTTHCGGGVVDIRTAGVGLDAQETKDLNKALRDAGCASWIRDSRDGMSPHIHSICTEDQEASSSANAQVASFDRGRNGLRGDGKDRNAYRPDPELRFSYKQGKPVPR